MVPDRTKLEVSGNSLLARGRKLFREYCSAEPSSRLKHANVATLNAAARAAVLHAAILVDLAPAPLVSGTHQYRASYDIQRVLHVDQIQPKRMSGREPRNVLFLDAQSLKVLELGVDKPLDCFRFHGLDFCTEYTHEPAARARADRRERDSRPVVKRGDVGKVEDHPMDQCKQGGEWMRVGRLTETRGNPPSNRSRKFSNMPWEAVSHGVRAISKSKRTSSIVLEAIKSSASPSSIISATSLRCFDEVVGQSS